jgi:hypothetical protein
MSRAASRNADRLTAGPAAAGPGASPVTEKLPLTVIIPTYNEEETLPGCLDSVGFADDVIVVDSFSTDSTPVIARARGARFVQHEYVNSATQKNWAIPQARHEWVLLVDSDERVTPELALEIAGILQGGASAPGYWIRRRNHFLGREMKHGGWETDAVIRLFQRDRARYQDREVHSEIDLPGPLQTLRSRLVHHSFRSWKQYWPRSRSTPTGGEARPTATASAQEHSRSSSVSSSLLQDVRRQAGNARRGRRRPARCSGPSASISGASSGAIAEGGRAAGAKDERVLLDWTIAPRRQRPSPVHRPARQHRDLLARGRARR